MTTRRCIECEWCSWSEQQDESSLNFLWPETRRTTAQILKNYSIELEHSWNPEMVCFKIQSFAFHFSSWKNVRAILIRLQRNNRKVEVFVDFLFQIPRASMALTTMTNSYDWDYTPFNLQTKLFLMNFTEEEKGERATGKKWHWWQDLCEHNEPNLIQ